MPIAAMEDHSTVPVTITYAKPGTQPPLFVAGTFSDPQWEPQEMNCTTDEDGNHVFVKTVRVPPGTKIQYKIRVGLGDWWVLNEDAPTTTDDVGNRNNSITALDKPLEMNSKANGDTLKPKPVAHLQDAERERLSSTPVGQVADTAAEVADTADKLDDEVPDRTTGSESQKAVEPDDEEDGFDGPPLFAHECCGETTYSDDEPKSPGSTVLDRVHHGSVDYDLDKYDLNDPSLERWPSDRKSIIDAVRKVETGRNEDQTYFLGSPVSPIMGARKNSYDEDAIDLSGPLSPTTSRKLDVPRKKSHSSVTSNKSLASLASIVEDDAIQEHEEKQLDTEDQSGHLKPPTPLISVPSPAIKVTPDLFASPASDEDEGVVLKGSRSKLARNLESGPTPMSDKSKVSTQVPVSQDPVSGNQTGKTPKPETPETSETAQAAGTRPQKPDEMDDLDDSADDNDGSIDSGRPTDSTTTDDQDDVQQRDGRASATQSSSGKHVTGGHWLPVFFRVLFYDWIGGFLSRMFKQSSK